MYHYIFVEKFAISAIVQNKISWKTIQKLQVLSKFVSGYTIANFWCSEISLSKLCRTGSKKELILVNYSL